MTLEELSKMSEKDLALLLAMIAAVMADKSANVITPKHGGGGGP